MYKPTFGEFLIELRKEKGYMQREVAEKLNVSEKTVSSWEKDRTTPDLVIIPEIADLYGISIDELLRGKIRRNGEENEDDYKELYKKRKNCYGNYSSKCVLSGGIAIGGDIVVLLDFALLLYAVTPVALIVIFGILGFGAMITGYILLFYSERTAMTSGGLNLTEEYTDADKAFALALKRRTVKTLYFTSLPFIVMTVIFLFVFISMNASYSYRLNVGGHVGIILATAFIALAVAATAFYYNLYAVSKSCDKNVLAIKQNRRFAVKIFFYSLIPVLTITAVLIILFVLYGMRILDIPSTAILAVWYSLIAVTAVICIVIFIVKRKRYDYRFNY